MAWSGEGYPRIFNLFKWDTADDISGVQRSLDLWLDLVDDDDHDNSKLYVAVSGGVHSHLLVSGCRIYGLLPRDTEYIAFVDAEYANYCISRGVKLLWDSYGHAEGRPLLDNSVLVDAEFSHNTWHYLGEASDEAVGVVGDYLVHEAVSGVFETGFLDYPLLPSAVEYLSLGTEQMELSQPPDHTRLLRIRHYEDSVLPMLIDDGRLAAQRGLASRMANVCRVWEEMLGRKHLAVSLDGEGLGTLLAMPGYFEELAAFAGVDTAIKALDAGVPLEDILK